jgi:hypothetical protein
VPKGSLGSHLGLHDPFHGGHCVLDGHHFEFLGDPLPAVAFVGLSEHDDLRYAFLVAYRDAKTFGR